jgi:hypothetical protein
MVDLAQGPLFQFAFTLMILGLLRLGLLRLLDMAAAWVALEDRRVFWRRLRLHVLWFFLPSLVLRKIRPNGSPIMLAYHLGLAAVSLVFRLGAVIVPAFMIAHVYLWERGLGVSWPALPPGAADVISLITIGAGLLLFLGQLYSPVLRSLEPGWSFLKPLLLILPFITGMLSMHPIWNPMSYHVMLLLHVLTAALIFVLLPFARMLSFMHTPLAAVLPEADWRAPPPPSPASAPLLEQELVTS